MSEAKIILVGGGARSGKSRFALDLALRLGDKRVFLATAEAGDAEMSTRIRNHQAERGDNFLTVEAPIEIVAVLRDLPETDIVLLDCLTLWLSNLLLRELSEATIRERVTELLDTLAAASHKTIIVSNEVGMGLVPESALGRVFRDLTGHAHQEISRRADAVYFAALGMILRLKPAPVEMVL